MSAFVVAVAYSAGRDSTALLHATASAAAAQGGQVLALHVHHGLSPHADAWLSHAQAQCDAWAEAGLPVQLLAHRVAGHPQAGESIEAWARQVRYQALRQMALENGAAMVLLAHHQRDQAETLLLQGLRGAGVAGLAGMPASIEREGITWVRPWLARSRHSIEAYVAQHRLQFIDDDSNTDPRFARNRLRLQVWPELTAAFPQAEASLADAASWAAEAAACLDELAQLDLAEVADAKGLQLDRWQLLSSARQTNVLRAWLKAMTGLAAPASLLMRLREELPLAEARQWPIHGGLLRRHRGHLAFASAPVTSTQVAADPVVPREASLGIRRAGRIGLPGWGGTLVATRVKEGGIPIAWLAHLELRGRQGGEQFQGALGRPARSLKKQYQAANVPAWEREGPLIYSGGQLLFVPGLGVDVRAWGLPGQAQLHLHWHSS